MRNPRGHDDEKRLACKESSNQAAKLLAVAHTAAPRTQYGGSPTLHIALPPSGRKQGRYRYLGRG